jgi:hypothetical protein
MESEKKVIIKILDQATDELASIMQQHRNHKVIKMNKIGAVQETLVELMYSIKDGDVETYMTQYLKD